MALRPTAGSSWLTRNQPFKDLDKNSDVFKKLESVAQDAAKHIPSAAKNLLGGLAGGYTGARLQSRMPDLLIRRLVGVLVIGIGAYFLSSGLG